MSTLNFQTTTIRELIYVSYANLAMAHSAVTKRQKKYTSINFIIRARLLNGLKNKTMTIGTIFEDEKIKLHAGPLCTYCGSTEELTLDHIFPKKKGGKDSAENLVLACKSCNSSKGKKDLIEWIIFREKFVPLLIIRRYLKLIFNYCNENELLDKTTTELKDIHLPFRADLLPLKYPQPTELVLHY
jgi:hypothetical protein